MTRWADLPCQTVGPGESPITQSSGQVLRDAMLPSRALADFLQAAAGAGESVLLVVNDAHRGTRTREAMAVLAELGTRLPRFRLLVATGTHRFAREEQARFGDRWRGVLPVDELAWHDADRLAELVPIHTLRFHRWVAQARFLLPIGGVEPHYFAGLTGAHKTVTIGCMGRGEIARNHAHAMSPAARIMESAGNPVHEDIVATLRVLLDAGKRICAVNQVVCAESVVAAAAGDPLETLEALRPVVRRIFVKEVDRPADLLWLRVPLPLGRSLYQADKALKNNHAAVRDGGAIVLEAACPEGVGDRAFLALLERTTDYASARRWVQERGYCLGDHKAVLLRHLTDPAERGVHVALVSSHVRREDAETAGMRLFSTVPSAFDWLDEVVAGPRERVLRVEDAGFVTVSPSCEARSSPAVL